LSERLKQKLEEEANYKEDVEINLRTNDQKMHRLSSQLGAIKGENSRISEAKGELQEQLRVKEHEIGSLREQLIEK
jgi:predicted nuclease with TOPRIM domain